MTDTFTIKKIPDTAPFTIEELSNMTMVQIMASMNHYRKLSIGYHSDKIELIKKNDNAFIKHMDEKNELKRKYTIEIKELSVLLDLLKKKLTKPKRKQIKATKSDLQGWLYATESLVLETTGWSDYSDPDTDPHEINSMFECYDGRYNKRLRPTFRGMAGCGHPDKVDIEEEEEY